MSKTERGNNFQLLGQFNPLKESAVLRRSVRLCWVPEERRSWVISYACHAHHMASGGVWCSFGTSHCCSCCPQVVPCLACQYKKLLQSSVVKDYYSIVVIIPETVRDSCLY